MIDFEKDQENVLKKTDNIQSLADQVQKLNDISLDIEKLEESLKVKSNFKESQSFPSLNPNTPEFGLFSSGKNLPIFSENSKLGVDICSYPYN